MNSAKENLAKDEEPRKLTEIEEEFPDQNEVDAPPDFSDLRASLRKSATTRMPKISPRTKKIKRFLSEGSRDRFK